MPLRKFPLQCGYSDVPEHLEAPSGRWFSPFRRTLPLRSLCFSDIIAPFPEKKRNLTYHFILPHQIPFCKFQVTRIHDKRMSEQTVNKPVILNAKEHEPTRKGAERFFRINLCVLPAGPLSAERRRDREITPSSAAIVPYHLLALLSEFLALCRSFKEGPRRLGHPTAAPDSAARYRSFAFPQSIRENQSST